ncbi:MAG: LysM peptidoglycan-binding domain-containing protein [Candidatus Delongbacteria bacterium]|nr:LysM peptidoglycan-binding domain-containing protein [Candidatus Delongbacteria bacterium]MBN2836257.1 LysM peptidoglycan-binding domain-containing protein [Candidatus Delongbacteria bacterium]
MKKIIISMLLISLFGLIAAEENRMEYEKDYLPQFNQLKNKIEKTENEIKSEEGKISNIKSEITTTQTDIDNLWNEIYTLLTTNKGEVDSYRSELNALENEIKAFGALPNEELFKRQSELDNFEQRIAEKKAINKSYLSEMENMLNKLTQKVRSIRSSIVVPYVVSYVVERGDNLWKISGKEDIYNDPFKWTDIYKANKETIRKWQKRFNATLKEGQKEEDLIYPGQEFTIPR